MSSIDERIVDMQFNNGEFEKGIKESMKSLEDLKKALELDKQTQSLNNLEKAVSSMDFQKLSDNVEKLSHRFSTLGIVGMTALQNIANKVTDTVAATAKSLAFGSILEGKGKYEMKLESVQAIKAATGQSIEEIEAVFTKLTEYTDWTSYSFSNMANTIGQFVSKGIDLDVAELAMEGIGNAAADAGASIQNANVAMYNFAQAIAAGKMTHMDWISINKTAHMGTKKFEEVVIDTAIELGKLQRVEDHVGKTAKGTTVDFLSFDSTLKEGWYDTDVIIQSLLKFADTSKDLGREARAAAEVTYSLSYAMATIKDTISSGWMTSFQHIFGNLDEASDLFSTFTDMIVDNLAGIAQWRNGVLKAWKEMGGRSYLFEGLFNVIQTLFDIVRSLGMAFRSVFPEDFATTLANMSMGFYNFSVDFRNMFGFVDAIEASPATSLFSTIAEGSDAASQALTTLVGGFKQLEEFTGSVSYGMQGDKVKKMQEWLIEAGYAADESFADGIYGPKTREALLAFQKDAGLVVDGVFGQESFAAMQNLIGGFEQAEEVTEAAGEEAWFFSRGLKNIYNVAQGVFSIFRIGWKVFTFGFKAVTKVLGILKPFGRMLLSIGSFIGQIVSSFESLIDNSGIFELALAGLDMILAPVLNLLNALADAFDKLLNDGFVKFQNGMAMAVNLIIGFLSSLDYQGIGTTVLNFIAGSLSAVGTAIMFVVGAVKSAGGLVSEWFKDLGNTLMSLIPEPVKRKLDFLLEVVDMFKKSGGSVAGWFEYLKKGAEKAGNLKDSLKEAVSFDSVKGDISWVQQALVDAGYTAKDFIVDGLNGPKTKEAIEQFQKDMGLAVTGTFNEETFAALQKSISGTNIDSIIGSVTDTVDKLKEKIQGVIDTFGGDFSPENVYNTVRDWVAQIWKGFKSAIGEFFFGKKNKEGEGITSTSLFTAVAPDDKTLSDNVHDWILSKLTLISEWLTEAFSSVGEIGSRIFGTVTDWFGQIWGGIIDTIAELIFGKKDKNSDLENRRVEIADAALGDFGGNAWFGDDSGQEETLRERVKNWLLDKLTAIGEAISNVLSTAKEKILSMIPDKWKNIFKSIYSALFEGEYDKDNEDISDIIPFLDKLVWLHEFIDKKVKPAVMPIINFLSKVGGLLWNAILTFIDPSKADSRWKSNETKLDSEGNPIYSLADRLAGFKWIFDKIKNIVKSFLGNTFKWLGDKIKWVLTNGYNILGTLLGLFLMYGFGKLTKSLSGLLDSFNSKFESMPTKLLKIAGAFALFAAAIWVLSRISWPDYGKVATVVVVAVGIAKLIAWLFDGSDFGINAKAVGKTIKNLGTGILSLVGAVAILIALAFAVGLLMKIPGMKEAFWEGAKIIGIMAAGLLVFVFALSGISKMFATKKNAVDMAKMGKGVLKIVEALAILVALAAAVGWYVSDEERKASLQEGAWWIAGFAGGLVVFIGALATINKWLTSDSLGSSKNTSKITTQLVVAVGAIVALALTAASLGKIPKARLWRGVGAVAALAGVVGGLALVLAICGRIAGKNGAKSSVGMLLPLAGAIAAIVIVAKTVEGLMKYDPMALAAGAAVIVAIGAAIALMAAPVAALGNLSLGAIAKGAIAVVAIGAALSAVAAIAISVLSSVAGFAANSLSTAIWDITSTLKDAAGYVADVDFSEEGKLNQALEFMKDFAKFLTTDLGNPNFEIVGNLTGALYGLGTSVSSIYRRLPDNAEKLQKVFEDTVGKITELANNFGSEDGAKKIRQVSDELALLAGSLDLYRNAITKLNGGGTTPNITPVGEGSGGTSVTTAIASAFSEIAANLPKDEDLQALGELAADSGSEKGTNLARFASGVSALNLAISSWNSLAQEIDISGIDASIGVVRKFVTIEGSLHSTESIWPWAKDHSTDMNEFSNNITGLGDAIGSFADNIGGGVGGYVRLSQVKKGVSIIKEFAGIQNSLAPAGTFFDWTIGSQALATTKLGKSMGQLGSGLRTFNDNVNQTSWDVGKTSSALEVLKQLGTVYSELPEIGGLNGFLFGDQDITTFADNMDEIGKGLVRFDYVLQKGTQLEDGTLLAFGSNNEALTQGIDLMTAVSEAIKNLANNVWGESLATIGNDLELMAIHFMHAFTILNGGSIEGVISGQGEAFVSDRIDNTLKLISNLLGIEDKADPEKLRTFLSDIATDIYLFYDEMTNGVDVVDGNTILNSVTDMLQTINQAILTKEFKSEGNILEKLFSTEDFDSDALASELVDSVKTSIEAYISSFSTAGKHLSNGLAAGIRLGKSAVVSAARAVMAAALRELKEEADEHSPSKVTQEYGQYLDEGLAIGLSKYSRVAEVAAKGVMDSTLGSIRSTIGIIYDELQNGIESKPVISPVVDLSNVSTGVGLVNGMFGQVALSGRTTFGGLSRLSFDAGGNGDVVAAINDLSNRLDNVTAAVRNMKVVTETGALVGEISAQMDQALGAREVQKRRMG